MAITYIREDQATILTPPSNFPITSPPLTSTSWAMLEGGDLESEDVKTRPGGMLPQVNLGGPTTRTDATISRPYTMEIHPYIVKLEENAGNGAMNITYRMMGADSKATGPTVTLSGILKNVTRPNFDSNANAVAMFGLVMGCDVHSSIA